MSFIKRMCCYMLIILFIVSIYNDLTAGTPTKDFQPITDDFAHFENFTVIKVQVQRGDTVLSITEQLNQDHTSKLNMNEIVSDFKLINSNSSPYNLKIDHHYHFPLYNAIP